MLFVPSPVPTHFHLGSVVRIASSLRHTPPPAVPTHIRQPPLRAQRAEIARAETRPEMLPDALPLLETVEGPRFCHTSSGVAPPRITLAANVEYFCALARATSAPPTSPGNAC